MGRRKNRDPGFRKVNGEVRRLSRSEIDARHEARRKERRDKAYGGDTEKNGKVKVSRVEPAAQGPRGSIAERYRALENR